MKIEFIISSYKNPENLMTILSCLKSQTSDLWVARVFADGPYDGYEEVKNIFINDPKITFTELDGPHGDWGNTARNIALRELKEEWVVMTGHDNYYTPVFVECFLREADSSDVNFVFCNMIHDHNNYVHPVNSYLQIGYIDMGNFMTRSKYSSQLTINSKSQTADGEFALEYVQKFGGVVKKIDKFLYVHN